MLFAHVCGMQRLAAGPSNAACQHGIHPVPAAGGTMWHTRLTHCLPHCRPAARLRFVHLNPFSPAAGSQPRWTTLVTPSRAMPFRFLMAQGCCPAIEPPEPDAVPCSLAGVPPCVPPQVDIWALGICIYQWTFGRLPFTGAHASDVFEAISSQPVELPTDMLCSAQLTDLLTAVRGCSLHCPPSRSFSAQMLAAGC